MKAQIRMIIASVIVIALALTAVSGITYSWFSDTEQSDITITTAEVDYTVGWEESGNNSIGTAWTIDNGTVTITGLAANAAIPVIKSITNGSSIKTVYKISATAELASGHNYTLYDLKNIYIGGTQLNATSDGSTITLGETVIVDWTTLDVGSNPAMQTVSITTPQSYGGETADKKIVAYNPTTGEGSTTKNETYTADWTQAESKTGLTITLSVVVAQGDYPYETMDVDTTTNVASAVLPTNKIVKAAEIASKNDTDQKATNVILDFSNVEKVNTDTDITGTKVTAEVQSINTTDSTVTIDLNLFSVSGETETKVTNPTFDNPVVITMTVPGAIANPKVVYTDPTKDGGTVLSSTINGTGSDATTTIVFSVKHFSEYVIKDSSILITQDELKEAMATGGSYKIGKDLTNVSNDILVSANTTLDLNGYDITFSSTDTDESNWNIKVAKGASLTVTGTSGSAVTFSKTWGFRVYGDLTIDGDAGFATDVTGDSVLVGTAGAGAKITINGGMFTAAAGAKGQAVYTYIGGDVTINGGNFIDNRTDKSYGWLLNQNNDYPTTTSIKVYGGIFTNYNPADGDDKLKETFVASGYVSYSKDNTNWTVLPTVAQIGTTYYTSIDEAFTAYADSDYKAGTALVLMTDIKPPAQYAFNKDIIIDLNEHTFYFTKSSNQGYLTKITGNFTLMNGYVVREKDAGFGHFTIEGNTKEVNVTFQNITYTNYYPGTRSNSSNTLQDAIKVNANTVNNVNLTVKDCSFTEGKIYLCGLNDAKTITTSITDCTFVSKETNTCFIYMDCYRNTSHVTTVSGCTFDAGVTSGSKIIDSRNFNSDGYGSIQLEFKDSTVTAELSTVEDAIVASWASITVIGGTNITVNGEKVTDNDVKYIKFQQ